jgi:TolB protein
MPKVDIRKRSALGLAVTALILLVIATVGLNAAPPVQQQDWIRTGTGLGVERVRMAVPDFRANGADPQNAALLKAFNDTLFGDLEQSGLFEVVSKSFYPLQVPGNPQEMDMGAWSNPPPNANMVAFGNLGVLGGQLAVQGWLFDAKNTQSPQVLAKQYRETPSAENARMIAHKFADEIIFQLGGGIPGIAETKVYFVSSRSGHKEIWAMDYDGQNQHQVTHINAIASLSPRVSPDGSRIAFTVLGTGGAQLAMWSLELNRRVTFPGLGGTNLSPAWSGDGLKLAFSSSMQGDPEIYTSDPQGAAPKRITAFKGPDVSPTWNPKTNAQIAWVSGRTGLPQIYIMDADGTNAQRVTDEGYAVSPAWSPNGQFLVFSWIRHYGPGAPGAQDIYIMDVATRKWAQLTSDGGRNDFPSWAPDGRHIVFQSNRRGGDQIWSMLADGTQQHQLTTSGSNTQPNWSK